MHDEQTLTVLMPAYNAGRFIAEAIESVLAQTYGHFTLLIVDDGSKDDTLAVARSFEARDPRVRVKAQSNRGIANTLNEALAEIETEWVACMHADDVMMPNRLERQVAFLRENPDLAVASSLVLLIDETGSVVGRTKSPMTTRAGLARLRETNQPVGFNHPATIFRRDVIRAVGGYRQDFWPAEDTELWNRVADAGHAILVQDEYLLKYRIHGSSASMSKSRLMIQKLHWMERCLAARRAKAAEPTWEQFLASRGRGGLLARLNCWRREIGSTLYQNAIHHFTTRAYGRLVPALLGATLLEPAIVLPRVLPRLVKS